MLLRMPGSKVLITDKKRRGSDYRWAREIVGRGFKPDLFDLAEINDDLVRHWEWEQEQEEPEAEEAP
jgi:hypothetical protein